MLRSKLALTRHICTLTRQILTGLLPSLVFVFLSIFFHHFFFATERKRLSFADTATAAQQVAAATTATRVAGAGAGAIPLTLRKCSWPCWFTSGPIERPAVERLMVL